MKYTKYFILIPFCFYFFLFSSCTPKLDIPIPHAGDADFSKSIAIGGNYLAGYQDGALYQKGQKFSIPAMLAEQFKLVGAGSFNQALMPDNNGLGLNFKTWESSFVSPSHLAFKTDCIGVSSLKPVKNFISTAAAASYLAGVAGNSFNNLAVPYASMLNYSDPNFGNSFSSGNKNPFYHRFASNPGLSSIYSDALAQNATFITAWLGMEDIYNYAQSGGITESIPSAIIFAAQLDTILAGLTANGSKGVIATIPDFRTFPYYNLVAWDNADLRQTQADSLNDIYIPAGLSHIKFNVGRNGFVIDDEFAIGGVRQLHNGEYITLSVPLDSMKCQKYGLVFSTINDRYALDSSEVYRIDEATNSYNALIIQKAAQYNLALVDMNAYFKSVIAGIKWDGADFNADFVSGGFFSLDGYHPNQKGYALIANEFIKAINIKYNALIPPINCVECDGVLFP